MADRDWKFGHGKNVARNALLAEVARLKPLLPDTPVTARNLAAIEKATPIEKMDHSALCNFVDLLARSVPATTEDTDHAR